MRPIDADELSDRILYLLQSGVPSQDIRRGIKKVYTMLCDTPTIEAEPVKHGRLVNKGAGYVECSVCGQIYTNIALLYKCCPYCTARFDGGVKDA